MPRRVVRRVYRHQDQIDAIGFAKYQVRLANKDDNEYRVDVYLQSGLKARVLPNVFKGRESANAWIDHQIVVADD